jgi:hypothetical protein
MNDKIVNFFRCSNSSTTNLERTQLFSRAFQATISNPSTFIKTRGIHFLTFEKHRLLFLLLFYNQPEDKFCSEDQENSPRMSTSRRSRSLSSGSRVSGRYGELVANPRGLKRRVRQRLFGVVVCATGEHKYKVRFENDLEKVCFSTSLRVESHVICVPLIESLPLLPAAQQEEAQGGAEDADDEEEEEENDFRDMLAGIEDGALPTDCNIEADEYEDLFGH